MSGIDTIIIWGGEGGAPKQFSQGPEGTPSATLPSWEMIQCWHLKIWCCIALQCKAIPALPRGTRETRGLHPVKVNRLCGARTQP